MEYPTDNSELGDFSGKDFSGKDLFKSDFSEQDLVGADFSGADLRGADFSGADLTMANFSEANLLVANFSGANLGVANFSGAHLVGTDLSGAHLLDVNLSGVSLSVETLVETELAESKRIFKSELAGEFSASRMWDAIARMYHELKTAYSANGLAAQARKYYLRERWARRKEAKAAGGFTGYSVWMGSLLSRIVTGYGVQLRWTVGLMLLIYLLSALVYWKAGMGAEESLYYSIVTFTTAPPDAPPSGLVTKATAMFETFGGTLLIVLLGYVLGNREQI